MAGRQDIEAGRAYVSLQLRQQQLAAGLASAKQRLQDFGAAMARTGGKIALVGASITAPLSAAVKMYREIGEKLTDTTGTATQIAENNKLRASYARLGVTFTKEGIAALGKSMDEAATATKAITLAIGQALAPVMAASLGRITRIVSGIVGWIRHNGELFRTIYRVGGAVTIAGLAIIKLGAAVIFAGSVLGGLSAILGVVLTPAGLIVTTLVAAAAAFIKFSDTGKFAFQAVTLAANRYAGKAIALFKEVAAVGTTTWDGIVDAVSGGDLMLAAQIAVAGLYAAFLTGTQDIQKLWVKVKFTFLELWTDAKFATLGIVQEIWSGIQAGWSIAIGFMETVWDKFLSYIADTWNEFQKRWGNAIITVAEKVHIVTKEFADAWRTSLDAPINEKIAGRESARESDEQRAGKQARRMAEIAADGAAAQSRLAEERRRAEAGLVTGQEADVKSWEQARLDAQKKLNELRDKARRGAPGIEAPPELAAAAGGAKSVGSFSAAALVALGSGQGPAAEAEKTRKDIRKNVILMQQEIKRLREEQAQRRMVFA